MPLNLHPFKQTLFYFSKIKSVMLIKCIIIQLNTKNYILSLAGHFVYILTFKNAWVESTLVQCLLQQMITRINVAFTYDVPGTVLSTLQALSHLALIYFYYILLVNPFYR